MKRALAIVTVLSVASPAVAEEPSWVVAPPSLTPPTTRPVKLVRKWYGNKTILVDFLSFGSIAVGLVTESGAPAILGLGGLWLGAPAVHLAHGEGERALASFLMRPGLVVAGAYLGVKAEDCNPGGEWCGLGGLMLGSLVGLGVAATVDAIWSYEVSIKPIVHPRGETYGLGLTGSF